MIKSSFYLSPMVSQGKSFNQKAIVEIKENQATLKSYNTLVATVNTKTKEFKILGYHSVTTGRHINAFLSLYGLPTMTKKEILNAIA